MAKRPLSASAIVAGTVLLLVIVGALGIVQRRSTDLYFARALPAWHQLSGDDVRSDPGVPEAAILGRYTTKAVDEGQMIANEDLGPILDDAVLNESAVLVVPSLDMLASELHAGDIVSLHAFGSQTVVCPVRVLEVRKEEGSSYRAVAAIPGVQAASLSMVKDEKLLLAMRVWGYSEGAQQPGAADLCG